ESIVRAYLTQMFGGRADLRRLDDLFAPDAAERQRRFLELLYAAIPDLQVTVYDVFASGTRAAARFTFSGTHQGALGDFPATGQRVEFTGNALYDIREGRIAESWTTFGVPIEGHMHPFGHILDNIVAQVQGGGRPPRRL